MVKNTGLALITVAEKLGQKLLAKRQKLTTAESCTGGWVAQIITSVAGSSQWFERGFVTYSNEAKQEMLAVKAETIANFGAVSKETVLEMAVGALQYSHADISIAVTGIAGPDGGTAEKPVGTVWFAWAGQQIDIIAKQQLFSGNRYQIREQAVAYALEQLLLKLK